MKSIAATAPHLARHIPTGNCVHPGCGLPVIGGVDERSTDTSLIYRQRNFLCPAHWEAQVASEEKKKRALYDAACAAPRLNIENRCDKAIPPLHRDVMPLPEMMDAEFARISEMLLERITCANFDDVYVLCQRAASMLLSVRGCVIVLAGLTGTGKTTAAALILRMMTNLIPLVPYGTNVTWMEGGIFGGKDKDWPLTKDTDPSDPKIAWATAEELFEMGKESDVNLFRHVPIAVIDEVGPEPEQVNLKAIPSVVWSRYQGLKSSVLTTGFIDPKVDPAKDVLGYLAPLAKRYGDSIVRRIAQPNTKKCLVIPFIAQT